MKDTHLRHGQWMTNEFHTETLRTAVSESPLLAYMDSLLADWVCEECSSLAPCEHDGARDPASLLLQLIYSVVAQHRSTARVVTTLGGDPGDPTKHACTHCREPWPCATIRNAEKATKVQVDAWIAEQPWGPQLPYPFEAATRIKHDALVVASLGAEGHVLCPHCGEDVSDGIEEWRAAVNAAYDYKVKLELRMKESLTLANETEWVERQGTEWASGYRFGLDLALSHAGTQLNVLLGSHHPHISFYIAQREAGHINKDILI